MEKSKKIVTWAIALGIIVLINVFIAYAIEVVAPAPRYDTYCEPRLWNTEYRDGDACIAAGGQWTEFTMNEGEVTGSCNPTFTCTAAYEQAQSNYNRSVFIVYVIVGVLLMLSALFALPAPAVASGVSFAGVLALLIGALRYWSFMDDYVRLIILAVAIGVLVWIGSKKIKD